MVFAAFVPGLGQSIAQGGRYDDIGADFGRARPATGFSTDLRTLVALGEAASDISPAAVWAPLSDDPALWSRMRELRASGRRVIQALPGQAQACAAELGCDSRLEQREGTWQLVSLN
jgi:ATP phosphoribosyltransferase regulatory subunit